MWSSADLSLLRNRARIAIRSKPCKTHGSVRSNAHSVRGKKFVAENSKLLRKRLATRLRIVPAVAIGIAGKTHGTVDFALPAVYVGAVVGLAQCLIAYAGKGNVLGAIRTHHVVPGHFGGEAATGI